LLGTLTLMATTAEVRLTATAPSWTSSAGAVAGGVFRSAPLRAVLKAIGTVFFAITLTFFIVRLMPGNPIEIYIDKLTTEQFLSYPEALAQATSKFSVDLNRPLHEQYISYLGNLARADLGSSILSEGTPVSALLLHYLPWTVFAVGTGLLTSFAIGIALGLLMAYKRNSAIDHTLSSVSAIVSSVPDYLIGILLVVFLGVQLRWLPITQMRGVLSPGVQPGFTLEFFGDALFHASLPIVTYVLTHAGIWMLTMKNSTLAALEEDFVTAARARGLSDGRITTAYVGRNAILPLFTQFTISAGFILGGAVFIEFIFVYQGLGWLLFNSINQRDYPIMQGVFLLVTGAVVLSNLLADLVYGRLDPRIGRAGGRGR
jgi:peptide/nickel transport system permease protein